MWNRPDLKAKAKYAYKKNYWKCVLVGLVAALLGGQINLSYNVEEETSNISNALANLNLLSILIVFVGVIVVLAFGFALAAFLLNPLIMGTKSFFLKNRRNGTADPGDIFEPFSTNYINNVKTLFMVDLITFLWTLLLVVPGIIKSYEYKLVPYIIYENPDMNWRDAMQLSSQLMNGNKGPAFVLDLSFIGWMILSGATFNILGLFMVFPYIAATDAELYIAIAHPEESNNIIPAAPESKTVEFETTENK